MQSEPAPNIKSQILARIGDRPLAVWTPVDFLDLAPRAATDKALQRLTQAGKLRRIDRGLYDQPRLNSLTGQPTVPDHRAVIDAIGRRDQARLLIDPMTAANDLGLTTAVPARIIIQTDARLKPLRLDNLELRFKQTAPSKLHWAGRPAMRFVQALYWVKDLLQTQDEQQVVQRLRSILAQPDSGPLIQEDLKEGLHTLPIWMQSIVRNLLNPDADSSAQKPLEKMSQPTPPLTRKRSQP